MANEKRLIDGNRLKMRMIAFATAIKREYLSIEAIVDTINTEDTVDAVEVKHGWWIELPSMEPDYKCSECGRSYAWWEPSEAHYCPFCGARMDLPVEVDHESS